MGDININSLKCNSNFNVKSYFDMLTSFNLFNIIKNPTRITENSSTLIDHFYVNNPEKIINNLLLLSDISDHFPLLVTIQNCTNKHTPPPTFYRNYSKLDHTKLMLDASITFNEQETHNLINSNNNIDTKFEKLSDRMVLGFFF